MIDVIFLLLTFFIYNMVIMHNTKVLPVQLLPIAGGAAPFPKGIHAITINRDGLFFFDRQALSLDALDAKLAELAADPERPTLFLAVEKQGNVDRGPLFVQLIERVVEAGITDFAIVGPPSEGGPMGGEERGASHGEP